MNIIHRMALILRKAFMPKLPLPLNKYIKPTDIEYELQLLFGADSIVEFIESHDNKTKDEQRKFGNVVNYFKDSVYLHGRNLLNALTNQHETDIGLIPPSIESVLYRDIKPALEKYVMHLNNAREQKGQSNIIKNSHLNTYAHEITEEVHKCIKKWKKFLDQESLDKSSRLQKIYEGAQEKAKNDSDRFQKLFNQTN